MLYNLQLYNVHCTVYIAVWSELSSPGTGWARRSRWRTGPFFTKLIALLNLYRMSQKSDQEKKITTKIEHCGAKFYHMTWEVLLRLSLRKKRPKNWFPDTRGVGYWWLNQCTVGPAAFWKCVFWDTCMYLDFHVFVFHDKTRRAHSSLVHQSSRCYQQFVHLWLFFIVINFFIDPKSLIIIYH